MVQHDEQHVILIVQAQHRRAPQRSADDIERALCLVLRPAPTGRCAWIVAMSSFHVTVAADWPET